MDLAWPCDELATLSRAPAEPLQVEAGIENVGIDEEFQEEEDGR